jgi:WD40 repeat protein
VFNVAFSPDGRFLASVPQQDDSNKEGEVSIWDLNTGKERYRLKTGPGYARCATFSPDGRLVAIADWDRHVILWDLATGKEVRRLAMRYDLQSLAFPVQNLAFSPDGKVLATTLEGAISLWEVATGQRLPASAEPDTLVHDLYFSGDGQRLISVIGGLPITWDCATGREVRRFPDVRDFGILPAGPPVISPDESLIATQGEGGTIRLHDAATGKEVRVLRGHEKYVGTMLFLADGRRLFSSGRDKTIRVWEVTTGRELLKLITNDGRLIYGLATSLDGRWLAALTDSDRNLGESIVVWDLTTGREAQRFKMRCGRPTQLTFSPDGRLLAAACGISLPGEPGRVQVWDVTIGKEYAEFVGHKEHVLCLAFSADGRMLATGGFDHTVRLWELASGRQRAQFNGHEGSIYAVAFSPDGRVLAVASPDAPIYLWDVAGRLAQPQRLTPAELEKVWMDLGSEDAAAAFRAVRRLAAAPEPAVPFLQQQMRPVAFTDAKRLTQLIADLDNERFEVRQQATEELEKLGELAEPALRKALAGQPTLEARRRLEQLVEKFGGPIVSPAQLQALRAVEVLEHICTSEARQVLESLAKGAPEARLTREARAALQRLDRQSAKP